MQQGIIAGAKKMVLPIVNAYPNYILPYQILAHCDFLTEKRESSATYFSKLITLHPEGKSTYLYYLGASYYHLKQ